MMLVNWLNLGAFTGSVISSFVRYNSRFIADVSHQYPTLITPLGVWFVVTWSIIYLTVGLFCVWQVLQPMASLPAVKALGPWLLIASLCQLIWVPLWNYEDLVLSCMFMLGTLASLTVLNLRLDNRFPFLPEYASGTKGNTAAEHPTTQPIPLPPLRLSVPAQFFVRVPFSIWFGWITLASAINLTVALQNPTPTGPKNEFFESPMWASFMLLSLFVVARIWASLTCDFVYGFTLAWGVLGIAIRDLALNFGIGNFAGVVAWGVGMTLLSLSLYDAYLLCTTQPKIPGVTCELEKKQPPTVPTGLGSSPVRPMGLT